MDIDNNFEEFPNIEERQKDFNCSNWFYHDCDRK